VYDRFTLYRDLWPETNSIFLVWKASKLQG
jgi:hypothetical protein